MGFLSTILFNIKNMKRAKKYRAMGKENLLALSDEDFYDAVECMCDDAVFDIHEPSLTKEQVIMYSLCRFEAEVNNGGLCQFFVNSSGECAPFISEALGVIGANEIKGLFDQYIKDKEIDVNDLSVFKIQDLSEFKELNDRFDFDSFDDRFYEESNFHQQIIDYARKHIEQLMKE